jgi:hypothetical protein
MCCEIEQALPGKAALAVCGVVALTLSLSTAAAQPPPVDTVEDGQWNEPEYLESIRRYSQKVTLVEAGDHTVALKLVTPGPY